MLAVVSDIIAGAIGKIIGVSVDSVADGMSQKATLAARLIELHHGLNDLETTSRELARWLQAMSEPGEIAIPGTYVSGKSGVFSRKEVWRAIHPFGDAVRAVDQQLKATGKIISVYAPDLYVSISWAIGPKDQIRVTLDLLMASLPRYVEAADLSRHFIQAAARSPSSTDREQFRNAVRMEAEKRNIKNDQKAVSLLASELLTAELVIQDYDISDPDAMRGIFERFEKNVSDLEQARRALGKFIKDQLPLEKILRI